MTLRDAKLTDCAPELVLEKRNELIKKGWSINTAKGIVVNMLLNEYAELKKQHEAIYKKTD